MSDVRQFSTFWVHGHHFGIDVFKVQEVLRYQEMTRVPLAPAVVTGLINLRGQIVTAVDLRRRLQLPPLVSEKRPMNVIVRSEEGIVSLLVDEIGEVLQLSEEAHEQPPETVRGPARELIRAVYKLADHLLLVIDPELTVSSSIARAGAAEERGRLSPRSDGPAPAAAAPAPAKDRVSN